MVCIQLVTARRSPPTLCNSPTPQNCFTLHREKGGDIVDDLTAVTAAGHVRNIFVLYLFSFFKYLFANLLFFARTDHYSQ